MVRNGGVHSRFAAGAGPVDIGRRRPRTVDRIEDNLGEPAPAQLPLFHDCRRHAV